MSAEGGTWTESLTGDNIKRQVLDLYKLIEQHRVREGRIKCTINNPVSSRGHLMLSIKVTTKNGKTGYWHVADLAGNEDPLNIARGEIRGDADRLETWNDWMRKPKEGNVVQQVLDEWKPNRLAGRIAAAEARCENAQMQSTEQGFIQDTGTIINQGFYINESNNMFLMFLRSRDSDTPSVNPLYGVMDRGMRAYRLKTDKLDGSYGATNGVVTRATQGGGAMQMYYELGDKVDDRKRVLTTMYGIKTTSDTIGKGLKGGNCSILTKSGDEGQSNPAYLTKASEPTPAAEFDPFETLYVKKELLEKLTEKSWSRYEFKWGSDAPTGVKYEFNGTKIRKMGDEKEPLALGSNNNDIDYINGKYDAWFKMYYEECARTELNNTWEITATIQNGAATEQKLEDEPITNADGNNIGNVAEWKNDSSSMYGSDWSYKGTVFFRSHDERNSDKVKSMLEKLLPDGVQFKTFQAEPKFKYWDSKGKLVPYAPTHGLLKVVTVFLLAVRGNTSLLLEPKKDFYAWIGNKSKNRPMTWKTIGDDDDDEVNRLVVYFRPGLSEQTNEVLRDASTKLFVVGQCERDKDVFIKDRSDGKYFAVRDRIIGPNTTPSNLGEPINQRQPLRFNQECTDQDRLEFLPSNPLIVGPELAVGRENKNKMLPYTRYDNSKLYGHPNAGLYRSICEKPLDPSLREVYDLNMERPFSYSMGQVNREFSNTFVSNVLKATQTYCVQRWNDWEKSDSRKLHEEPLAGYNGMISFMRGCVTPRVGAPPPKVVVCLTARSERMHGDDKRRAQAEGVKKTMVYADLLNPYSLRSILQIQKGKEKTDWTQSWDVFTRGMLRGTNATEEMFQLPSLLLGGGRSLRTITTAGGTTGRTFGGDLLHLSDLAPSSSEDEMEESVVMEFDLHSDGSGDGALW